MLSRVKRLFWAVGLFAVALGIAAPAASASEIVLTPENTIVLRGPVTHSNTTKISSQILASKADKLYLFIDSPGGSIFSGLRLIDVIKSSNKKIVCVANTAISMAFIILQACDERLIVDNAVLMQHMPSYGMEGPEPNNYQFAQFIHNVSEGLYEMQSKRLGMRKSEFFNKIRDDWWLFDDEAIRAGAADRKTTVSCSKSLIAKREQVTEVVFIFTIKLTFSGCPLIAGPLEDSASSLPPDKLGQLEFQREYTRLLQSYNAREEADRRFRIKTKINETLNRK